MKSLKFVALGFIGFFILICLGGFFLPSHIHLDRSIVIQAPVDSIFKEVVDFHNWDKWSSWHKKDPKIELSYAGPQSGVGSSYTWKSENGQVGSGRQVTMEVIPNKFIKNEMYFMEESTPSYGSFTFEDTGNGIKVTQNMDSDAGINPIQRLMGKLMELFVGPEFEQSLSDLKKVCEGQN
jgi:hypothetical protein